MKNLIENWLENWTDGLSYLITDDLISFYAFFTVILAECSYLLAFYEFTVSIPITVILLGYMLNVIVFARLKGNAETITLAKVYSVLYVAVFVTLFIIGCFFNRSISITTTAIPLGITVLWIVIRVQQDSIFCYTTLEISIDKITYLINKLFCNNIFWTLSQIIVIGAPFILFAIFFSKISFLPIALKVIIPLLYLLFSPFIAYFEDCSAALNIFELAYEID